MVDDELHRHDRVHLGGISPLLGDGVAKAREVHQGGLSQDVVAHHPRREPGKVAIALVVHYLAEALAEDGRIAFANQVLGVDADDQRRIFERFFRADNNDVDGSGSAGLGLAICRHIARNYGGEVWVESPADPEAGRGSRFLVRLPVA